LNLQPDFFSNHITSTFFLPSSYTDNENATTAMRAILIAAPKLLIGAGRRLPIASNTVKTDLNAHQNLFFRCLQPHLLPTTRHFSGHSKWSNIRHKKGAKDKARAAILGKASRAIAAASRDCGGDLTNLRLQSAISHAKAVQLPKNRIEEAISIATKASSKSTTTTSDQDLVQLRFDAMMNFDGSKVACVITALTDNRNRTTKNVRHLVSKEGGELLPTDNLAYVFVQVGLIVVEKVEDEDALLGCALEAGASNVEEEEDDEDSSNNYMLVTTDEKDLWHVVTSLRESGYEVAQFEHRYILQDQEHGGVELSKEGEEELETFLEKMDENEDVNNVYHNAM
jgi:YebC/PmpR family DNA-binding regulatory protein